MPIITLTLLSHNSSITYITPNKTKQIKEDKAESIVPTKHGKMWTHYVKYKLKI